MISQTFSKTMQGNVYTTELTHGSHVSMIKSVSYLASCLSEQPKRAAEAYERASPEVRTKLLQAVNKCTRGQISSEDVEFAKKAFKPDKSKEKLDAALNTQNTEHKADLQAAKIAMLEERIRVEKEKNEALRSHVNRMDEVRADLKRDIAEKNVFIVNEQKMRQVETERSHKKEILEMIYAKSSEHFKDETSKAKVITSLSAAYVTPALGNTNTGFAPPDVVTEISPNSHTVAVRVPPRPHATQPPAAPATNIQGTDIDNPLSISSTEIDGGQISENLGSQNDKMQIKIEPGLKSVKQEPEYRSEGKSTDKSSDEEDKEAKKKKSDWNKFHFMNYKLKANLPMSEKSDGEDSSDKGKCDDLEAKLDDLSENLSVTNSKLNSKQSRELKRKNKERR